MRGHEQASEMNTTTVSRMNMQIRRAAGRHKSQLKWFLLLLCFALPSVLVIRVLAAQVTVDDSASDSSISHNGSSPTVVFTNDLDGYAFYKDFSSAGSGSCVYKKTTDGGGSWSSPVNINSDADCIKIAVWYDRWTPGDNTGTNIHVLTARDDTDDLYYTRLDTSTDTPTTTVNATGANQGPNSFTPGESIPSITKATNGTLYMGIQDDGDSFVIKCSVSCDTATNWTEAGTTSPFGLAPDWLILMPLTGGNIIAVRWDISADSIQSRVYDNSGDTWDASWTDIDLSAQSSATYDAGFGATINKSSGAIFLAYVDIGGGIGTDDIKTAAYNGVSWTAKANVLTADARGVTGIKIASKENSDNIYAVYTARTTAGTASTANVYWKASTDGMSTWGSETQLNTTSDDIYGARVNIISNERIYATWYIESTDDLLGNTVADLAPTAVQMSSFTAKESSKGVVLEWKIGFEVDNLGFNIYREQNGKRVLINKSLISGSALMAAPGTGMTASNSYKFTDPKGTADSVYYLEDVDLNGATTVHDAVTPSPDDGAGASSSKEKQSLLLGELNNNAEKTKEDPQRGWATPITAPDSSATAGASEFPIPRSSEGSLPAMAPKSGSGVGAELLAPGQLLAPGRNSDRSSGLPNISTIQPDLWQKMLAGMPALKLAVRNTGWYRVSQPELIAAGLTKNADMRDLQLYADGVEVPIRINSTKSSGPLKPGDSIEFYGVGLNTPSTDTRDYWLTSGVKEGKRINPQNLKQANTSGALQSFNYTVEHKERLVYFSGLLNGEAENFFGKVINNAPATQTLSVEHLDTGAASPAKLQVALQGVTLIDHSVKVLLNGTELGILNFSAQSKQVAELSIASGLLHDGDNTVTLQSLNSSTDISLVDYLRLTYAHTYQADNDYLQFTLNGRAQVGGFSVPDVMLLDVTNPNSVRFYNPKPHWDGRGYRLSLESSQPRTFLALTNQGVRQVSNITANQPSNWGLRVEGADFVIITHRNFRNSVEPLAQLRRSQGMSVAVVDVEDVYDEFSHGAHSPQAIRDFLAWARFTWLSAPRFVLLAGDGSYDPRNYLGGGDTDLVPTRLIDTALLETASDDWFVDFNDDGIAEMAIGRLPVRTVAEADIMISKIVNYSPANAAQNALMVADKMDTKTNFNFEAASNQLSALLPATIGVQKVFRGDNAPSLVHDQIVSGINQGPLLVNFLGHGSVEVWTGAPILSTLDAAAFNNGPRLPVFFTMTCLNGYYQNPARESMAESFLRTGTGGAVAVWASSGMTSPEPQFQMNSALYEQLFGSQPVTLGEAIRNAKAASGDRDVLRTWILFGDPTIKLR